MAQLDRSKSINGAIGNIVFKKLGNKQILQSKPDSIRQTKRTLEAGNEFRQCSSWAKWLRMGLRDFLGKDTDATMHGRFAGHLYSVLQLNGSLPKGERTPLNTDMSTMAGFEFNTNSPFSEYFLPEISAELNDERQVVVTVPGFNPRSAMQFAPDTRQAELLIYVLYNNFQPYTGFPDHHTVLSIPNEWADVAETTWTSPAIPEGHLVMVCAKLLFYRSERFTEKKYVNGKECSPSKVLLCL